MTKYLFLLICIASLCIGCGKLTSDGDSLDVMKKDAQASEGKTYTLTLNQVNIEVDDGKPYVRLFDKGNETIFLYFKGDQKNQIANLERSKNYIYKFKAKYTPNWTLNGELLEVADLTGKPVSKILGGDGKSEVDMRVQGKDADGKEFELTLEFRQPTKDSEDKECLSFYSADTYSFQIQLYYPEELKDKIGKLEQGQKIPVKFKIRKNEFPISGDLISL